MTELGMSKADVKVCQEFEDHLRNKMTSKDFWEWVSLWFDIDIIIDDALSWTTEMKKEQLEDWKKEKKNTKTDKFYMEDRPDEFHQVIIQESDEEIPLGLIVDIYNTGGGEDNLIQSYNIWYDDLEVEKGGKL
jgi:hypothetical protein